MRLARWGTLNVESWIYNLHVTHMEDEKRDDLYSILFGERKMQDS